MADENKKMYCGLVCIGILAGLQITAWLLNKDGAITATLFGLLGLVAGSVFGFELKGYIGKKEG